MGLIELVTSGGLGAAFGALVGIGERFVAAKQEIAAKRLEYSHVETMHRMKQEHDVFMARNELDKAEIVADQAIWTESFKHDAALGETSKWVNNVRALVRPSALVIVAAMATWRADPYLPLLAMILTWYFASRVRTKTSE